MSKLSSGNSSAFDYSVVALSGLLVGVIDYATGADVHVLALYFFPLAFAGWRLGRMGAAAASLLSTFVWLAVLYAEGARHRPYVWMVNFVTQGAAYLLFSILVAILVQALRKEQFLRRIDSLTGLKNRQAFVEDATIALSLCRRNRRPVSLACIDLDNFKLLNDSMGHGRGDAVLRAFGGMLAGSLRASDIAARIGGDEFVVLLPETSREQAAALMKSVSHALAMAAELEDVAIGASNGVVVDEAAESDIEGFLMRADAHMYVAKRRGKSRASIAAHAEVELVGLTRP